MTPMTERAWLIECISYFSERTLFLNRLYLSGKYNRLYKPGKCNPDGCFLGISVHGWFFRPPWRNCQAGNAGLWRDGCFLWIRGDRRGADRNVRTPYESQATTMLTGTPGWLSPPVALRAVTDKVRVPAGRPLKTVSLSLTRRSATVSPAAFLTAAR